MSDRRPIGMFDSGVGGLTVVSEIERLLPHEDIVYFGDTARVPYGAKSKKTVTRFSVENVEFLMEHDVKMAVVACNTASGFSLDFLKRCFRVPIVGVIEPGARCAVNSTRNGRIGVVGTRGTISSGAYERSIRKIGPKCSVFTRSCPLFVPLVEEGWTKTKVARDIASSYLDGLKQKKIDTLIMGCTHYPILREVISRIMGRGVFLVDSAREVAKETKAVLNAASLLSGSTAKGKHKFFVSDEPGRFIETGEIFLKKRINCVKRTDQ